METADAGGLTAAEVLRVLAALDAVGIRWWIGGGRGVDALAGKQTRVHRDLDLPLDITDATPQQALSALSASGYRVGTDSRPSRVELAASPARWVTSTH